MNAFEGPIGKNGGAGVKGRKGEPAPFDPDLKILPGANVHYMILSSPPPSSTPLPPSQQNCPSLCCRTYYKERQIFYFGRGGIFWGKFSCPLMQFYFLFYRIHSFQNILLALTKDKICLFDVYFPPDPSIVPRTWYWVCSCTEHFSFDISGWPWRVWDWWN